MWAILMSIFLSPAFIFIDGSDNHYLSICACKHAHLKLFILGHTTRAQSRIKSSYIPSLCIYMCVCMYVCMYVCVYVCFSNQEYQSFHFLPLLECEALCGDLELFGFCLFVLSI